MDFDEFDDIEFELKGSYQQKNRATILCAAKQLGISREAIKNGMANVCETTGLIGRWQTLSKEPLVICDTGHNTAGWQYLSEQIKQVPCSARRIVFGMVDDKDINTVMTMLPKDATYYWTQAETKRAISHEKVKETGKSHGLTGNSYPTVIEAYRAALSDSAPTDFVFVGGSSYVVADLLSENI